MQEKRTFLRWFDLLCLTLILFGEGIINSTSQYIALQQQTLSLEQNLTFSPLDNYKGLAMQSFWLLLAFLYLKWRRFDFNYFKERIQFSPRVLLQALGLFMLIALCMDIFNLVSYNIPKLLFPTVLAIWPQFDISLILYSILNGFYEEFFFLGLCLAVKPDATKWAFIYSLLIRFSFHTYQGIAGALGISLILGILFYVIYRKLKPQNLLPFFISHAIADIFGLSLLAYILS
ncbi:CPBP family intramembrane glutamic endopeptidase [Streptococcus pseudoporcinus]|uniref:Abortive infection protein n=1 Tax=Streptococcus pseudoporcinus TaxID=361101 RepID=A0A4U9XHK0_9STRE|nr:CPBP family intramembrane glutamic endopeptidase [Streptococcus pseudoporcinus]VTS12416.1 abortive infection protein [Streptococcus pseudoporcinus]VUC64943.1 abortive infection protein [Streptococcus pseudoporcinus]VUC95529.1 abortive infection protein [Streptococcus pseudoporcinus]VUC95924.1 abortive infection protein [Streptococcus pseudoporcinus]